MGKKWDRYCQFEWILADLRAFLAGFLGTSNKKAEPFADSALHERNFEVSC
jgi:hypothetical protein